MKSEWNLDNESGRMGEWRPLVVNGRAAGHGLMTEMIVNFRGNPPALSPLPIMNSTVTVVESFRFLGITISQDLKWDNHIDSIV